MTKYPELMAFELIFRISGVDGKALDQCVNMIDQIYELGYNRGKQDAVLESLMGEDDGKTNNSADERA